MPSITPTPTPTPTASALRGARAAVVAAAMALCAGAAPAAVLTLDAGGRLLGARGVEVQGRLYDVSFSDGSCVALFNGCDALSDFTFNTLDSGYYASVALLEQVFNAASATDLDPALTRGCEGAWGSLFGVPVAGCWVLTPTLFSIDGQLASSVMLNDSRDAYDQASRTLLNFGRGFDIGAGGQWARYTFAVWTPAGAAATVSAPGTAGLALAALGLMAGVVRRTGRRAP